MLVPLKEAMHADGILADPPEKRGQLLPDNVKQAVLAFYEDEEFSRICPGQKDNVHVKMPDGTRETKTKRLLLANLKELHMEFKKRHPDLQIGLSKFCVRYEKYKLCYCFIYGICIHCIWYPFFAFIG